MYQALAARVRPESAEQQAAFVHHLDTEGRVVIEIVPGHPHRLRRRGDVPGLARRAEPHEV